MKKIRIAIDGPAGAGKSTISRMVAEKLGYIYVDTGAMYRSTALFLKENDINPTDEIKVIEILSDLELGFVTQNGINKVYIQGSERTRDIRSEEISMAASKVSAYDYVRKALFQMQRNFALKGGVVMEGRDIGTVIMPEAELKIFLTASPEIRAKRRLKDINLLGETKSFDEMVKEIKERDTNDMNRKTAPLKKANDAVELDSSDITIEETVDKIVKYALTKIG